MEETTPLFRGVSSHAAFDHAAVEVFSQKQFELAITLFKSIGLRELRRFEVQGVLICFMQAGSVELQLSAPRLSDSIAGGNHVCFQVDNPQEVAKAMATFCEVEGWPSVASEVNDGKWMMSSTLLGQMVELKPRERPSEAANS